MLPVSRGQSTPVAGLTATSPAGTQIGDIVVVVTHTSTTVSGIPTHTTQTNYNLIGDRQRIGRVDDERSSKRDSAGNRIERGLVDAHG